MLGHECEDEREFRPELDYEMGIEVITSELFPYSEREPMTEARFAVFEAQTAFSYLLTDEMYVQMGTVTPRIPDTDLLITHTHIDSQTGILTFDLQERRKGWRASTRRYETLFSHECPSQLSVTTYNHIKHGGKEEATWVVDAADQTVDPYLPTEYIQALRFITDVMVNPGKQIRDQDDKIHGGWEYLWMRERLCEPCTRRHLGDDIFGYLRWAGAYPTQSFDYALYTQQLDTYIQQRLAALRANPSFSCKEDYDRLLARYAMLTDLPALWYYTNGYRRHVSGIDDEKAVADALNMYFMSHIDQEQLLALYQRFPLY